MTSTTIPIEQLETRLAELELKLLGVSSPEGSLTAENDNIDVTTRLDKLLQSATSTSAPPNDDNKTKTDSSKREALHNEYQTIDKLLSDLSISPISGPTESASSNNNAPMVYRRLEVLSSAESMKTDMELLAKIRDLTSIGRKATGSNSTVSADDVVSCSILSSSKYNQSSDPEVIDRLDRLCYRVAMLNQRAVSAANKVDNMVNSYGSIMSALNEKMVLAEEQVQQG